MISNREQKSMDKFLEQIRKIPEFYKEDSLHN